MAMQNNVKPKDLTEALRWRSQFDLVPYMGGTDLMVNPDPAARYLFLGDVKELQYFYCDDQGIHIGAGMTFTSLLKEEDCPSLLRLAMQQIASPAIRNKGSIGGNICNASPAGDTLPVLLIYDTELKIIGGTGERSVAMRNFILERKEIDLQADELLVGLTMKPKQFNHLYYHKIGSRRAMSISKIAFAGAASVSEGHLLDIGIGLASMYKTPLRFEDIESHYRGMTIQEFAEQKCEFVKAYEDRLNPIDDMRSTARYRKNVTLRLVRDFVDSLSK